MATGCAKVGFVWVVVAGFAFSLQADEAAKEKKLVSIVFLLKEPRKLDLAKVREAFSEATGRKIGNDADSGDYLVRFRPSMYRIGVDGRTFGLINAGKPYLDNQQAAAGKIQDLRARKVIAEHKAWLAIDALGDISDDAARKEAYRTIGKLIASLADEDCLGVFAPETKQLIWYSPAVIEKLKGENPLDALKWEDPPLIQVPGEKLKEAVAQARREFADFKKAFEQRKPGEYFAVKALLGTEENGEYIWARVTSIESGVIRGKLDNRPATRKDLNVGDEVEFKLDDLNDWLIAADKKIIKGGFTIKVMEQMQREGKKD